MLHEPQMTLFVGGPLDGAMIPIYSPLVKPNQRIPIIIGQRPLPYYLSEIGGRRYGTLRKTEVVTACIRLSSVAPSKTLSLDSLEVQPLLGQLTRIIERMQGEPVVGAETLKWDYSENTKELTIEMECLVMVPETKKEN